MTYDLKQVELSNTILLSLQPPTQSVTEIVTSVTSKLIITPTAPKLHMLKLCMKDQIWNIDCQNLQYTTSDLLSLIQASEGELLHALKEMGAFEYQTKWCVMSIQIQYEIMKNVIDFIHSEDWSFDSVDIEYCSLNVSRSFPFEVVERCLQSYFNFTEGRKGQLLSKKYVLLCAMYLLHGREGHKLKSFIKKWKKILKDDFEYNLELLK